ncbi:MAG: tetratricopeptide repeat protein, partial [Pseudomonadota bacterium]
MPEKNIKSSGFLGISHVLAGASLVMLALLVSAFTSCVPQKAETQGKLQKTVELHYQLGINYLNEGKTPQALKELLAAQTLAPGNADVEHALGLAYQRKGMYNEAIEQYKKALTKDPKFTEAKNNLGTAYLAKGEPDEAISKFEECLGDPNYSTPEKAAYNLGVAYNLKKDVDKAIINYERAALLKKDNINALFNLGFCYEEKKDLAK